MKTITLIAISLFALGVGAENPPAMTANKLLAFCSSKAHLLDQGFCGGYLAGVVDEHNLLTLGSPRFCVPTDATMDQLVKVFTKYADDHPEELHKPALVVASEALQHAFPCS